MKYRRLGKTGLEVSLVSFGSGGPSKLGQNTGLTLQEQDHLIKSVLRFGGAALYKRSQAFFLGLIAGQVLCNGIWLVIDYFTGKVGNSIFWV